MRRISIEALAGRFLYVHSCPGSTYEDIRDLVDAEKDISRRTFAHAIGSEQWLALQRDLGYGPWLRISKDDWHVGYYKSFYRGVPAVFLRHSAIEYIFTLDGQLGPSAARR